MLNEQFKVYIADGREYYWHGIKDFRQPDIWEFSFPESLFQLLYLDINAYDPLTNRIGKTLMKFYATRDDRLMEDVFLGLSQLADAHVYFKFLYADWQRRYSESALSGHSNAMDLLPRKQITHIPAKITSLQKQILILFEQVLDIDGPKKTVPERLAAYYREPGRHPLDIYQFETCSLRYELVDQDTFTEVLYPTSIYDIINFTVSECIRREVKMRRCKNCGKYFTFTGRTSAEYCNRPFDEKGRTCKDVGAITLWTKNKDDDEAFKEYRREYKRRFAWIKGNKILAEDFYAWSEKAREKKAACDKGEITLEEFSQWLKSST